MDVSQYLEIFIDESNEHLQNLSDGIMILEKEPDNSDTINEIFRAAHSLKGMAGTMGYKRMQNLTHDMENVFSEVRNGNIKVDSRMVDVLFQCLDGDYYGAWRAMEELYREGKVRAVGVCNFDAARLMDLCYNAEIRPMVNQIERHPHYQRHEELAVMKKLGVQPQGWAPFAEGLKGMFTEPVLKEIAAKHGKTAAQVILRWNVQQGVAIIPKSVHKERMEENLTIWDFALDNDDMDRITVLDKNCPSMLDCSKPGEIDRLYDYLNNPVLTTL